MVNDFAAEYERAEVTEETIQVGLIHTPHAVVSTCKTVCVRVARCLALTRAWTLCRCTWCDAFLSVPAGADGRGLGAAGGDERPAGGVGEGGPHPLRGTGISNEYCRHILSVLVVC